MFAPFWWSRQLLHQGWINPVTLMVICMMPIDIFRLFVGQMFLGNGLMSPSYQFAVLMTNLQQSITLFLFVLASRLQITRGLPSLIPQLGKFSPADLRRLSRLFFFLYLAAFLILAIRTGGVVSWLSDIRGSYIEKREGNGLFYAAAVSFLSISYFFEGVSNTRSQVFALRSLIYFCAIYVLGSKGFVLQFFIFSLIIFQRQGHVNMGRVLLTWLPAAFTLLLINFASQRENLDFSGIAEYFDYYPNAAMFYADYFRGAISLFQGKVMLTSLWEYVPRSFFPDKPFVYGILHVVEIYYPGGAESGNTPAFQGGVPQFADFGVPGVLFFALFNWIPLVYFAGLRYALKSRFFLNHGPMTGRTIVICLLLFAPSFGSFLPLGLVIMLLLFIVGLSKFFQIVRRTLTAI
jgi:hypothetical protein